MEPKLTLAIVDYGSGNLFSISQAVANFGAQAVVTNDLDQIDRANALILPGVGAFGEAMASLRRLGLVDPIKDYAAAGRPVLGICLGMQLLMTESEEFGRTGGLDLIHGSVEKFDATGEAVRVPQIGWNALYHARPAAPGEDPWRSSLLDGVPNGARMYFVHSFFVSPENTACVVARSRYGDADYAAVVSFGNVTGCQFHPERSGPLGLRIVDNFLKQVRNLSTN